MAEGSYVGSGSSTIEATGAATQASKEITVSGAAETDIVLVTPTSALPRINPYGVHTLYAVPGTGKITVYSSRNELPEDVTFNYLVIEGASE